MVNAVNMSVTGRVYKLVHRPGLFDLPSPLYPQPSLAYSLNSKAKSRYLYFSNMRLMSVSAAFLAVCSSLAAPIETKPSSLDVTLSQVDNTRIKAVVKNTGDEDITFMHVGFFGDGAPVKKVSVYLNGMYFPSSAATGADAL